MSKLLTGAATFAVMAIAPMSGWATIMETGTGFDIFDNQTDSSTIAVADDLLVDSLFITLDIAHTWVGDLTVTLTGPGGAAEIMVRTGGGGNINAGDGSDLGLYDYFPGDPVPVGLITTLQYTFADSAVTPPWWVAASNTGLFDPIPDDTYGATGAGGAPVSLNAIFNNTSTQGNWTLTISDDQSPDQGVLQGWALAIETIAPPPGPGPDIPVPATLALFGLGLAGLGWSRRKKA
jgi:hypothetical protein